MDELFSLLGWVLVELVLVGTGKAAVTLVTLGRWRGERLSSRESRVHGVAGALSFVREGRRVVTRTGLLFVGITVYALLIAIGVVL